MMKTIFKMFALLLLCCPWYVSGQGQSALTGNVLDAETGSPIEGVLVTFFWRQSHESLTNGNGKYSFSAIGQTFDVGSKFSFYFYKPGYEPLKVDLPAVNLDPVKMKKAPNSFIQIIGPDGFIEGIRINFQGETVSQTDEFGIAPIKVLPGTPDEKVIQILISGSCRYRDTTVSLSAKELRYKVATITLVPKKLGYRELKNCFDLNLNKYYNALINDQDIKMKVISGELNTLLQEIDSKIYELDREEQLDWVKCRPYLMDIVTFINERMIQYRRLKNNEQRREKSLQEFSSQQEEFAKCVKNHAYNLNEIPSQLKHIFNTGMKTLELDYERYRINKDASLLNDDLDVLIQFCRYCETWESSVKPADRDQFKQLNEDNINMLENLAAKLRASR